VVQRIRAGQYHWVLGRGECLPTLPQDIAVTIPSRFLLSA
jgi:hypothetical protein